MIILRIILVFSVITIWAYSSNIVSILNNKKDNMDSNLEHKIAQMLMIGFNGTSASENSKICHDIKTYDIGSIILFSKNIKNHNQLKRLTQQLQQCSPHHNLLIAIDQEGGKVQRLKSKNGFYGKYPSAKRMSTQNANKANIIYNQMALELRNNGINFNLAPVVDLDINKKNYIIHKLERSFSADPLIVAKDASIFINAMHKYHILTSLKHFPGHGSSLGDTHKGFVDVTNYWKSIELEPYQKLINKNIVDTIMIAHIFNKRIDVNYPASLSYKTVNKLLRVKMHYKGVVITDDLQMGAIAKSYSIKTAIKLAINAGDDILLFGNQVNKNNIITVEQFINIVKKLITNKQINYTNILSSYSRIQSIKQKVK